MKNVHRQLLYLPLEMQSVNAASRPGDLEADGWLTSSHCQLVDDLSLFFRGCG